MYSAGNQDSPVQLIGAKICYFSVIHHSECSLAMPSEAYTHSQRRKEQILMRIKEFGSVFLCPCGIPAEARTWHYVSYFTPKPTFCEGGSVYTQAVAIRRLSTSGFQECTQDIRLHSQSSLTQPSSWPSWFTVSCQRSEAFDSQNQVNEIKIIIAYGMSVVDVLFLELSV